MKFYFIRHGESEANILKVISNRGLVHGLTEAGRQQAEVLANRLKSVKFERIYTSPLLRAVQTAQILSARLKVPYEPTDALREFDCGIAEGRSDADAWKLWQDVWTAWMEKSQWDRRIDGGESWLDIYKRFSGFLACLIAQYRTTDANFILIGHGGTFGSMLPAFMLNYASFNYRGYPNTVTIVAEPKDDKLVCLSWE